MEDLSNYTDMELLRFTTAGSVDDGKSTLIGRLLYDSKSIFEDQYDAIRKSSELKGEEHVNLALLTDGLRAEREQGITIDVAYRYFATPRRKFIIADTPGHIQYTRNMVTGASTSDLALILIDARKGILEQTCRHAYIASLLGIPQVVFCINKMDLVEYSQDRYNEIQTSVTDFANRLGLPDFTFIPISALKGDNVVEPSQKLDWYIGPTLLQILETIRINRVKETEKARFPVQYVIRPQSEEYHDFRGYAGRISAGKFRKGDRVKVLPSGLTSTIKSIETFEGEIEEAFAPMSTTITLNDDIDISRGDMLVPETENPQVTQDLEATICWLNDKPLRTGLKYILRHTTREARCVVKAVEYKMDINKVEKTEAEDKVEANEIAVTRLRTTVPVITDSYKENRITGSFILIDERTNETVGAGMIQ